MLVPGVAAGQAAPFNPVAPSAGFLLVTEGDATLAADESEGPAAIGGNLTFGSYQVLLGSALTPMFPGDSARTALLVDGTINFAASADTMQVSSYVKLGDTTGADVRDTDPNGASSNTRILPTGRRLGLVAGRPPQRPAAGRVGPDTGAP